MKEELAISTDVGDRACTSMIFLSIFLNNFLSASGMRTIVSPLCLQTLSMLHLVIYIFMHDPAVFELFLSIGDAARKFLLLLLLAPKGVVAALSPALEG